MVLCQNRPEGFGPTSSIASHLPTTCFADVVVMPLATWLYLLAVLLFVVLPWTTSKSASKSATRTQYDSDKNNIINNHRENPVVSESAGYRRHQGYRQDRNRSKARVIFSRIIKTVYYILVIAMIGLVSVEIARLHAAELGIGLIPFTYAGLLVVLILHISTEPRMVLRLRSRSKSQPQPHSYQPANTTHLSASTDASKNANTNIQNNEIHHRTTYKMGHRAEEETYTTKIKFLNCTFWTALVCTMSFKMTTEIKEEGKFGPRSGQQATYPLNDQVTDDASMTAVGFVGLVLEYFFTI